MMENDQGQGVAAAAYQMLTAELLVSLIQRNVLRPEEGAMLVRRTAATIAHLVTKSDYVAAAHHGVMDLARKCESLRPGHELPRAEGDPWRDRIPT